MSVSIAESLETWERLTVARVRLLGELDEGRTEREAAERLHISYEGVRSHVEDLKDLAGCRSVRELARWWRANRDGWHEWIGQEAGIVPRKGYVPRDD